MDSKKITRSSQTDTEKAFGKIYHASMIKVIGKLGLERTYLNIIKTTYEKPSANIILNQEKTRSNPSEIRNETGLFNIRASFQYCF